MFFNKEVHEQWNRLKASGQGIMRITVKKKTKEKQKEREGSEGR